MLGNYRMAAQLVASRVALSSTESVIFVTGHGSLYVCEMLSILNCLDSHFTDGTRSPTPRPSSLWPVALPTPTEQQNKLTVSCHWSGNPWGHGSCPGTVEVTYRHVTVRICPILQQSKHKISHRQSVWDISRSRGSKYLNYRFLELATVGHDGQVPTFGRNLLLPSSGEKRIIPSEYETAGNSFRTKKCLQYKR
jgi:hypothetical protein